VTSPQATIFGSIYANTGEAITDVVDIDTFISELKGCHGDAFDDKHKNALHPVALAALFHAKFEQIHPFADGNGRVGRFIVYVMLDKAMPILFPNRKLYLDALEASQNKPLDSSRREDFDQVLKYFVHTYEHTWGNFFSER